MIGKIKSYDEDTQTGVIKSDEQFYEFHVNDWSEPVAPIIDSDVLFEDEGENATMVTLIGSYLDHQEAVKSRRTAIALALFPLTGLFGGHRWYLGFYKLAVVQTIFCIVTVGFGIIWPCVDAFLLYTGKIYKDQQGRPLK
ncbi:TM2 domain-containing protein [Methyloprofundus sp.]|uniref:TM2 domain-containing protein n=1 Tax=Methyloprofundus sp. TaxID=2020875 RepID=UPI003D11F611